MPKIGVTLIEVLVVVVILGILAGVALPVYNNTKENALGDVAVNNLKFIIAAEKRYRMDNQLNNYQFVTCDNFAACNSLLKLRLNSGSWNYKVTSMADDAQGVPRVKATAIRNSGMYKDCSCDLSSDNSIKGCSAQVGQVSCIYRDNSF